MFLFFTLIFVAFTSLCLATPGQTMIDRQDGFIAKTYPTPADAIQSARDGDVLQLDGGVVTGLIGLSITRSLTLQGSKEKPYTELSWAEGEQWITLTATAGVVEMKNIIFNDITAPLDTSTTSLTIRDCIFRSQGSAIIIKDDSSLTGNNAAPNLFIHSSQFFGAVFQTSKPPTDGPALGGLLKLVQQHSNVEINMSSFMNGHSTQGGGALYVKTMGGAYPASLKITSTRITSCISQDNGGGIFIDALSTHMDSSIILTDVTIENNKAMNMGGGIYVSNSPAGSAVALTSVYINSNTAKKGGGEALSPTAMTPLSMTYDATLLFKGNQAIEHGGGLYLSASSSKRSLQADIVFQDNSAGSFSAWTILSSLANTPSALADLTQQKALMTPYGLHTGENPPLIGSNGKGGGMYIQGLDTSSSPTTGVASDVRLVFKETETSLRHSGNSADKGGVLYSQAKTTAIVGMMTKRNLAQTDGGALYFEGPAVISESSMFQDRSLYGSGGAIYTLDGITVISLLVKTAQAGTNGGGIAVVGGGSIAMFASVQIVDCSAGMGGHALYYLPSNTSLLNIHSSLFYGNGGGLKDDSAAASASSAVVVASTPPGGQFYSTSNQYQLNAKGHLSFENHAGEQQKGPGEKDFFYKTTFDYFDAAPTKYAGVALNFKNVNVWKSYISTFFEGSCTEKGGDASTIVIQETCPDHAGAPITNVGGFYGAIYSTPGKWQIVTTGTSCEAYSSVQDAGACLAPLVADMYPPSIKVYGDDVIKTDIFSY